MLLVVKSEGQTEEKKMVRFLAQCLIHDLSIISKMRTRELIEGPSGSAWRDHPPKKVF